jgi:hypothetical protein
MTASLFERLCLLRARKFVANLRPRATGRQQKLWRGCQGDRPSDHNFFVLEPIYGGPDLVDSAYFNSASQRIFVDTLLFKFGSVVGQPTHDSIRVLLYLRFFTI